MTPIATIIENHTPNGRFINWTGASKTWLPGNSTVEVPFEVWSVCDRKQREGLIADLKYGTVSLAVRILKPSGNYETIPYNPIANLAAVSAKVPAPVPQASPTETQTEKTVTSNRHIVQAGDKEMSDIAKHFHLKAETVRQPSEQEVGADIKDTVEFKNGILNDVPATDEAEDEPEAEAPAQQEEQSPLEKVAAEEETQEEEAEEEMTVEQLAAEIDELLSAKAYEEAHKILVEVYGEEKITFKASALSRLKTFAAIVKKYKLDE